MPVSKTLVAAAASVYVLGGAAAYSLFKPASEPQHEQQAATFDSLADGYDAKVNFEETFMGLKLLRWWLVSQAKGDVLEISAGTGRNLGYYKWGQLNSLTVTDTSRHMLFYARQKLVARQPDVPVCFCEADAQHLCLPSAADEGSKGNTGSSAQTSGGHASPGIAAPHDAAARSPPQLSEQLPRQKFDTVIDTFGLCSHASPVEALKAASSMCKPGGRILLLEHGQAKYDWLNRILDRDAEKHRRQWACEWNRDIAGIVSAAGLTIEMQQRWHFGTTYVIIAKPCSTTT